MSAWKKQLLDNAARAFDPRVGMDAEHAREREVEKLHAKIGQLTELFVKNPRLGGFRRFGGVAGARAVRREPGELDEGAQKERQPPE